MYCGSSGEISAGDTDSAVIILLILVKAMVIMEYLGGKFGDK